MKTTKIALMTMLWVMCFTASSKDRFVMAKIILNNKDTLVNPIKYENVFDFQDKIEVKNDDGTDRTMYPLDAKGFYIIAGVRDTIYFESNCGLKFGLTDNIDKNCYFMMKKRAGKIPLYYFALTKLINMGVSMEKTFIPSYVTKYRDEWVVIEENNYVNQLQKFIKPFKKNIPVEIVHKLTKLEDDLFYRMYSFDDIPSIIDRLNDILK